MIKEFSRTICSLILLASRNITSNITILFYYYLKEKTACDFNDITNNDI